VVWARIAGTTSSQQFSERELVADFVEGVHLRAGAGDEVFVMNTGGNNVVSLGQQDLPTSWSG